MKRLFGWIVALAVLTTASAVFASGCSGCETAKSDKPCVSALSKVKLTDAQKPKVAALQDECKGISCPIATQKKMAKDLKSILDAKQYAQWEKACASAKNSGGSCSSGK